METPDELRSNADVEQLKAEISDTQAELQQTVAEIQDRLSPATLKHQAADTVREAATNVRENVREATIGRVQHMVRGQNPIPFALIGIGAAWLLANNRSSSRHWDDNDYDEYDSSWGTSTSYISSEDEFSSPYVGDLGSTTGTDMSSGTRRWASGTRQRASEAGAQARQRARRVATQARSRFDMMLHDNPMALGIAALAAGAVVGAALPRTETENEYLGEARDNLVESAKSMAEDSVESARAVAKETIQKVTGSEEQRK
jgi:ElaB/YqjD/DUF883 family membrane-anchored ribosome-binding protein